MKKMLRSLEVIMRGFLRFIGMANDEAPPARRVLQPDDDMLAMCLDDTQQDTRNRDGIEINCEMNPVSIEYVLTNPAPGETLAKIKCQCHDEGGKMICPTCTCQADQFSSCESFAQWCTANGHEELGGGPEFSICHRNPPS